MTHPHSARSSGYDKGRTSAMRQVMLLEKARGAGQGTSKPCNPAKKSGRMMESILNVYVVTKRLKKMSFIDDMKIERKLIGSRDPEEVIEFDRRLF